MKSIAMSKAKQRWPDARVEWERIVGDRRADVYVDFDTTHTRLGTGLAIECQHKNTSKNVESVTHDFIQAGVSVLWLEPEQFTGRDVDLGGGSMTTVLGTQLPDQSEWAGYHGVIKWLRQEKPSTAEIEVWFPIEVEELPTDAVSTFDGYQQVVKLGDYNNYDCAACGSAAAVYVRDPVDPEAVPYPRGAYLCLECPQSDTEVRKTPCAKCGTPHVAGDMYPYRARFQRLRQREGHVFDNAGVEWYCHKCAGQLPPLSDLR